ncbi:cystathionine beta-lyase [Palleronia marisminoris]|uniref:Cystathionine beta-lyase MetC n=1 Tax=Palleronia marisminoris TaxID=315423 RepID=A0A1Y5TSX9_9RHOB|nr:PLP-dependent transferase [Palleronia marisminoris]SFH53479.1 cystathionine beta-lyase [Palleronia marisminoris]SLN71301.1 Cystathionine beta-lyase MetC [Palleronia marisminoris]
MATSDLTRCVLTPRVATEGFEPVGIGVHRASTILFEDAAAYAERGERGEKGYSYGLYGTPTTRTLEEKLTQLEQATRTFLAPSGQAANALAAMAFLNKGDHLLLVDTVYPPMRDFALSDLVRMGITPEFFDPTDLGGLKERIRSETRLIWCESPGSTTMEIMDIPAAAALAHEAGTLLAVDNTWATPLNLKPLALGADIVTEALTKYVSGHSDVLMGSISVRDPDLAKSVKDMIGRMGIGASPDDASLVLRGLETLGMRLRHCGAVAQRFAERLSGNPVIGRVLFPGLPTMAGHEIFKRDFAGSSGVFSLTFPESVAPHVWRALDHLSLFGIGASWGGTRSLAAPMSIGASRSAACWREPDVILRLSIGLEDEGELWEDLQQMLTALARLSAAGDAAE